MKTMTLADTNMELALRESLTDEQVAELMADDMLPEYEIDYSKVRSNRFAGHNDTSKILKKDLAWQDA